MNRKILTTCTVLVLTVLLAYGMGIVSAPSECIVNGGFETGDFTGWTKLGDPWVTTDSARTGTYGCYFWATEYDGGKQTFVEAIPCNAVESFTLWFRAGTSSGRYIHIVITYSDLAETDFEVWSGADFDWHQVDIKQRLLNGKAISQILIDNNHSKVWQNLDLDDVSLVLGSIPEEPEETPDSSPFPQPNTLFQLNNVTLGTVTPGETRVFDVGFTFAGGSLTLQDARFSGSQASWFTTDTPLPKTYLPSGESSFKAVLHVPENASEGLYTVTVRATAIVYGYTVTSESTVAFEVAGSQFGGGFGGTVERLKETLVRLLGNPFILLLLLLLIAILSYYSLRKRR